MSVKSKPTIVNIINTVVRLSEYPIGVDYMVSNWINALTTLILLILVSNDKFSGDILLYSGILISICYNLNKYLSNNEVLTTNEMIFKLEILLDYNKVYRGDIYEILTCLCRYANTIKDVNNLLIIRQVVCFVMICMIKSDISQAIYKYDILWLIVGLFMIPYKVEPFNLISKKIRTLWIRIRTDCWKNTTNM